MSAEEWIDLAGVLVWPVVVLALGLALRQQIGAFLGAIGGRATKVSVMSVSVELAVASEATPPWQSGRGGGDVRGLVPAPSVNDSYFDTLRQSLVAPGSSDYFVVDLQSDGEAWLSSRLYLFSYLLGQLKGVRAVVFVGTRGDIARTYLGTARVPDLLDALGAAQPWLRLARQRTEAHFIGAPPPPTAPLGPTPPGVVEPAVTDDVDLWWRKIRAGATYVDPLGMGSTFLTWVQWSTPIAGDPPPGWLALPDEPGRPPTWEHASWIVSRDLTDGVLRDAMLPGERVFDDPSWTDADRVRAIVRVPAEFVALTTASGRFDHLVDRVALLDVVARNA
jgi:hypothetical protein